jgi:hypothetical protein
MAARDGAFEIARYTEEYLEKARNCKLADVAWKQVEQQDNGQAYSKDYACGFKMGYCDYLFAGGTGEPPALPPCTYWGLCNETPAGIQAMQDWFAGFRHGAAAARASGKRELVIIPMNLKNTGSPSPPPPPSPPGLLPLPPSMAPQNLPDPQGELILPPPRKEESPPEPAPLPSPSRPLEKDEGIKPAH